MLHNSKYAFFVKQAILKNFNVNFELFDSFIVSSIAPCVFKCSFDVLS